MSEPRVIGVRHLRVAGDVVAGRSHVYYGWWVLATATIAMAIGSGVSMSAFGLYVGPFEDEFGWTRAQVSLGFSASVLMGGLSGPLVGYWIDAKGARSAIIVGGALCALSYILLASTQTLWQFYVFYAVHAFCRQLMFFIPFQSLVGQWFRRRRGVALSVLGSGFSIGGFAILPLMAVMIDTLGWRGAYLFSGALVAAFFLPAGLLIIRNRPSDVGEYVDGDAEAVALPAAAAALAEDDRSITLKQAMRMPLFWVVAFGFMFLFFGMMGWMVHQVPFYESQGMSRGTAALIVSLSAGASIIARLSMGLVADRFQRFEVAVIGLLGLMFLAMGTLLISTSPLGDRALPPLLGHRRQRGPDGRIARPDQGVRHALLRLHPGRLPGRRDSGPDCQSVARRQDLRRHRLLRRRPHPVHVDLRSGHGPIRDCRPHAHLAPPPAPVEERIAVTV